MQVRNMLIGVIVVCSFAVLVAAELHAKRPVVVRSATRVAKPPVATAGQSTYPAMMAATEQAIDEGRAKPPREIDGASIE